MYFEALNPNLKSEFGFGPEFGQKTEFGFSPLTRDISVLGQRTRVGLAPLDSPRPGLSNDMLFAGGHHRIAMTKSGSAAILTPENRDKAPLGGYETNPGNVVLHP